MEVVVQALPSSENETPPRAVSLVHPYFHRTSDAKRGCWMAVVVGGDLPWFVVAVFVFLVMAEVSFHAAVVNDGDGDGGGGGGCIARFDRKR